MSILAAGEAENLRAQLLWALAFLLIGAAAGARLFRPGRVNLPERLPPHGSPWPMFVALLLGLGIWLMVPTAYYSLRGGRPAATRPVAPTPVPDVTPAAGQEEPDLSTLPPADLAFLMTVPHAAVFIGLGLFDRAIFGGGLGRLGLALRQLPRGVGLGLLASVPAVPMVFGTSLLAEVVYRKLNYTHDPEHDLLRALGRSPSLIVSALLVLGATVAAPLSEELLFRGHLQTLLRRVAARLSGAMDPYLGPPLVGEETTTATAASATPPAAWATWAGIVATAALFTVVHEPWTWPPIFVLAVCLGYAYERTGNLWAPITMHAAFNSVSTVVYLLVGPGRG